MVKGATIFSNVLVGLLICYFVFGNEARTVKTGGGPSEGHATINSDWAVKTGSGPSDGGIGHAATNRALIRDSIKVSSSPSPGAGH